MVGGGREVNGGQGLAGFPRAVRAAGEVPLVVGFKGQRQRGLGQAGWENGFHALGALPRVAEHLRIVSGESAGGVGVQDARPFGAVVRAGKEILDGDRAGIQFGSQAQAFPVREGEFGQRADAPAVIACKQLVDSPHHLHEQPFIFLALISQRVFFAQHVAGRAIHPAAFVFEQGQHQPRVDRVFLRQPYHSFGAGGLAGGAQILPVCAEISARLGDETGDIKIGGRGREDDFGIGHDHDVGRPLRPDSVRDDEQGPVINQSARWKVFGRGDLLLVHAEVRRHCRETIAALSFILDRWVLGIGGGNLHQGLGGDGIRGRGRERKRPGGDEGFRRADGGRLRGGDGCGGDARGGGGLDSPQRGFSGAGGQRQRGEEGEEPFHAGGNYTRVGRDNISPYLVIMFSSKIPSSASSVTPARSRKPSYSAPVLEGVQPSNTKGM